MAEHSNIEWTDATWNPITGCSVVSPGCTNCYAMRLAGGRLQHHPSRAGLTQPSKGGPVWNGQVRLNEGMLTDPLRWTRPRRIFVCAHGDLFHEAVPDAWIDQVFAVMALARRHTFQVLTKRADRMRRYLTDPVTTGRVIHEAFRRDCKAGAWMSADHEIAGDPIFPLQNVWLGVSAEDQVRADERIPHLLATPAAVRFLSAEPLLGPIDLRRVPLGPWVTNALTGRLQCGIEFREDGERLSWVIAGGESGPGARPMHPDWARQIRDACAAAGVPFHFKQWGAWLPWQEAEIPSWRSQAGGWLDGNTLPDFDDADLKGWTDRLMYEGDDVAVHQLVGKKAAGRLLDGVEHNGMPEVR